MIIKWIDSIYLAKCIYNKGCNTETVLPDFPAYLAPYGTLKITENNQCSLLWDTSLNKWSHILLTNETSSSTTLCYGASYTQSVVISNYPYLESFTVSGKNILGYVNSVIFESTIHYYLISKSIFLLLLPFLLLEITILLIL